MVGDGALRVKQGQVRTMKRWIYGAVIGALAMPAVATAAVHSQTFTLQPGWNAVFLEVQPEPESSEAVFAGLPLASAWTWVARGPSVQFIQDPSEELIGQPDWLGYFPRPRPESFLTNLFAIYANRAYLLKIEGTQTVSWTVTGRPSLSDWPWQPDSFNLTGFHVDPASPPSFGQYLEPSPAHAGQPIFRLAAGGVWEQVVNPYATPIASGVAYWVYTEGRSSYRGPLALSVPQGDGLDYGGGLTQQRLGIHNLTSQSTAITVRRLPSPTPVALRLFRFDADTGEQSWPPFPSQLVLPTGAGEEQLVDLAVRRTEITAEVGESVLEIRGAQGYRRLVPVRVKQTFAPPDFVLSGARPAPRSLATRSTTNPFAGLWVGSAAVAKVSQAQTGALTPTPTNREFPLRLLIHVDGNGTVRFLREVIQVWNPGTMMPSPDDPSKLVVDEPGHYVLLTDETLIPSFTGATLRDGVPVGLRLSTVGYDFSEQSLPMNGSFGPNGSLALTLVVEADDPTNPFKHKYHPDHDNLDAQFVGFLPEAYDVTRELSLQFSATHPGGRDMAAYGESVLGGTYRENIGGLHRNDIAVEGVFLLQRASARAVLNQ
jgi:hypothetical protein